jgi:hypothetical protein
MESIMANDCSRGNRMNGRALSTRANVSPRQGSVSSATYRWLPPNTDRQHYLRPSGGQMEGLPLSPPSTAMTSLSISDSDSRFCLIAGGTITSVNRFCCLCNFFFERLLQQCHTFFLCSGSSMYAMEAACVLIDDGRVDFANT